MMQEHWLGSPVSLVLGVIILWKYHPAWLVIGELISQRDLIKRRINPYRALTLGAKVSIRFAWRRGNRSLRLEQGQYARKRAWRLWYAVQIAYLYVIWELTLPGLFICDHKLTFSKIDLEGVLWVSAQIFSIKSAGYAGIGTTLQKCMNIVAFRSKMVWSHVSEDHKGRGYSLYRSHQISNICQPPTNNINPLVTQMYHQLTKRVNCCCLWLTSEAKLFLRVRDKGRQLNSWQNNKSCCWFVVIWFEKMVPVLFEILYVCRSLSKSYFLSARKWSSHFPQCTDDAPVDAIGGLLGLLHLIALGFMGTHQSILDVKLFLYFYRSKKMKCNYAADVVQYIVPDKLPKNFGKEMKEAKALDLKGIRVKNGYKACFRLSQVYYSLGRN